ncbi:transcriptional regulator [Salmonella enterica subsp. enterica serovar Tilene]|uniref:Transcriptional regulator n=2 Tax=Salmonella enterica I TaxID=59201 RepID=A0A659MHL4_SALET|nr:transcriptional regulator [Salmonella enterica]EAA2976611.1 transcriptional regulator [Salmonella enterica subsp. enterica serovar Mbao]EBS3908590.1 transcriptional regulator [Salmonella enterica subsp. enterica serovar Tilene]EAU0369244.1 transcriptional regulator [Salmonella enterica]ECC5260558.1 transcriptional regulator [Salmonella enterica]ECF1327159.1 transcriptional regulator [Salmonella enterica subsp. enterica serovar Tilene]
MTKKDWHPADIVAALHKRGTSLAKLSREAGLASSTLSNTLTRPWPKGEWLIAIALDVHPSEIWPGRYLNSSNKREPRKPPHPMTTTDNSGT